MATRKGFTYNGPGDENPWYTVENQLDFDLMDNILGDSISPDLSDTTGHKHAKLYSDDADVAITAEGGDVKIGCNCTNPLTVEETTGDIFSRELALEHTLYGLENATTDEISAKTIGSLLEIGIDFDGYSTSGGVIVRGFGLPVEASLVTSGGALSLGMETIEVDGSDVVSHVTLLNNGATGFMDLMFSGISGSLSVKIKSHFMFSITDPNFENSVT